MEEKFPIFLEIINGQSIYEVRSNTEMLETQIIGKKYIQHHILAKIYPEKVLIADMLANEGNRWVRLKEKEYQSKLDRIKTDGILLS